MGLTLVAILTAALLLPGIVAARSFYIAGETREFDVPVPSLSSAEGIALVGAFSVLVHALYVLGLRLVSQLPPKLPVPLANPYLLFEESRVLGALDVAWALFSGLFLLALLAVAVGWVAGRIVLKWGDKSRFYGPLADVIQSASGDDKFITAYVVSKMADGDRLIGYQGTVDSLFRDADRFPVKVVLKDVVPFYLELREGSPVRVETEQLIDWLALSATDWHNIAFSVFQLVDENSDGVDLAKSLRAAPTPESSEAAVADASGAAKAAEGGEAGGLAGWASENRAGLGAALGIGSAALVAALLYTRYNRRDERDRRAAAARTSKVSSKAA